LAKAGAKVVLVSRSIEKLTAAAEEITNATKAEMGDSAPNAIAMQCDVTDPKQVHDLFNRVVETVGAPTILVNNAGGSGYVSRWTPGKRVSFLDFTPEELQACFALNMFGTFYCTQEFVRKLDGREASIINISSSAALITKRGKGIYGPAKGAVNVFTRGVAAELGEKGIRVNAICPGPTRTEKLSQRFQGEPGSQDDAHRGRIPMNRYGKPEDIAKTVVFLASSQASYLTGLIIPVDGGYTLGV